MGRIDQIQRLLENEPDDVFLNFSLAMEYESAGQAEDALKQFDRTIALRTLLRSISDLILTR